MSSGKDSSSSNDSSLPSPPSPASSLHLQSFSSSGSQIGYCIRTLNYLISTLNLPIRQITSLKKLTVEVLLRIHCALMGIDFSKEFIPAANPTEDVNRMILSLKDRFGADQFGALEPKKIAEKNSTQLRFLLEHFHLILNHQLSKASKSRRGEVENSSTNESDAGDSFETVENVRVNVFEDTASSDASTTSDPLFKDGVNPNSLRKPQSTNNRQPTLPLTSSPVGNDGKGSRFKSSHQSPNVSSIKNSPLQRKVTPTKPKTIKKKKPPVVYKRHQGFPIPWKPQKPKNVKSFPSTPKNVKTIPSIPKNVKIFPSSPKNVKTTPSIPKNVKTIPNIPKNILKSRNPSRKMPPVASASSSVPRQPQQRGSSPGFRSKAKLMSSLESVPDKEVGKIHTNIRNEISESLVSIDNDIAQLKRKPPKPKCHHVNTKQSATGCTRKHLPNLRWLMPVDLRFPNYTSGVIISHCTNWRSNRKLLMRPCTRKISEEICDEDELLEELSMLAQQGSGVQDDDNENDIDDLEYDE